LTNGFRVGVTDDFRPGGLIGESTAGTVESALGAIPGLTWEFIDSGEHILADHVARFDAVITGMPAWTAESFPADRLTLVASWGIGVDNIAVAAATAQGILVANSPTTPNVIAVAESALTLVLALSKRLLVKHRLTVQGAGTEAQRLMGGLVTDSVIGTIGFGRTAQAFARRVRALGPGRLLASDPYASQSHATALGVELVDLDTLLAEADYAIVMCTFNDETLGLLNRDRLRSMKPTAYLVNVARGPIVDQAALTEVLVEGRIAGAGLDVFETEPPRADEPLLQLENVIVTGHAIAWTTETMVAACLEPCRAVIRLFHGQLPEHIVNRELLEQEAFHRTLAQRRAAWAN
jgi:phosphoglycerate dehydrogenase-like enzyme